MARPSSQSKAAPSDPAESRRGRPTAARVAAIDSAIKTAALDLFVELGFDVASMDAIATTAKVSKGTLYARYPSKEPLFRAILEEQLEEWGRRSSERDHPKPAGLEAQLRQYVRSIVAVQKWPEYRRIVSLLETSARSFPDLARFWDETVTKRSVEALRSAMTEAGGPGVDWDFFANLFSSAITGWYRTEATHRSVSDAEFVAFADKVIDVLLVSIQSAKSS